MTITDSRPASTTPTSSTPSPGASIFPAAIDVAAPSPEPPQEPKSRSTRHVPTPNGKSSGGPTSPAASAAAMPMTTMPQGDQTAGGHNINGIQSNVAAGSDVPDREAHRDAMPNVGSLLDPALCLAADVLDDIERVRIANDNRLRQLVGTDLDEDGIQRGFGLDPDHPDVMRLGVMIETLKRVEHEATLELQRKMRKHPLGDWVKAQRGVGLKQGARLLAAIGDPYINSAKSEPRTVSALWAYCGLHVLAGGQTKCDTQSTLVASKQLLGGQPKADDHTSRAAEDQHRDTDQTHADDHSIFVGVAAKRRKGERANWSTKAKMRAYLIAKSCIQQLDPQCRGGHGANDALVRIAAPACVCSPYRVAYDKRRAHTAVTRPEWTDGHSHNDGLRVASKAILRDLWRAARDWHNEQEQPA